MHAIEINGEIASLPSVAADFARRGWVAEDIARYIQESCHSVGSCTDNGAAGFWNENAEQCYAVYDALCKVGFSDPSAMFDWTATFSADPLWEEYATFAVLDEIIGVLFAWDESSRARDERGRFISAGANAERQARWNQNPLPEHLAKISNKTGENAIGEHLKSLADNGFQAKSEHLKDAMERLSIKATSKQVKDAAEHMGIATKGMTKGKMVEAIHEKLKAARQDPAAATPPPADDGLDGFRNLAKQSSSFREFEHNISSGFMRLNPVFPRNVNPEWSGMAGLEKFYNAHHTATPPASSTQSQIGSAGQQRKEPHEMTSQAWDALPDAEKFQYPAHEGGARPSNSNFHQLSVLKALQEGKAVPPEVMADYPYLSEYTRTPPPMPAAPALQPHEMTRAAYVASKQNGVKVERATLTDGTQGHKITLPNVAGHFEVSSHFDRRGNGQRAVDKIVRVHPTMGRIEVHERDKKTQMREIINGRGATAGLRAEHPDDRYKTKSNMQTTSSSGNVIVADTHSAGGSLQAPNTPHFRSREEAQLRANDLNDQHNAFQHKNAVRDALMAGKQVPANVLRDYPEAPAEARMMTELSQKPAHEMEPDKYAEIKTMGKEFASGSARSMANREALNEHQQKVGQALAAGKTIPENVMNWYPAMRNNHAQTQEDRWQQAHKDTPAHEMTKEDFGRRQRFQEYQASTSSGQFMPRQTPYNQLLAPVQQDVTATHAVQHKMIVDNAAAAGKAIPDHVKAQYPHLQNNKVMTTQLRRSTSLEPHEMTEHEFGNAVKEKLASLPEKQGRELQVDDRVFSQDFNQKGIYHVTSVSPTGARVVGQIYQPGGVRSSENTSLKSGAKYKLLDDKAMKMAGSHNDHVLAAVKAGKTIPENVRQDVVGRAQRKLESNAVTRRQWTSPDSINSGHLTEYGRNLMKTIDDEDKESNELIRHLGQS